MNHKAWYRQLAATYGSKAAREIQEKNGQKFLIEENLLPKNMDEDTKQALKIARIKIIREYHGDSMFVEVVLPKGWVKIATPDTKWIDLVNPQGKVKFKAFYKASPDDREAYIRKATKDEM